MMRARHICILVLSVFAITELVSQDYPEDYFDLPLERRIYLSGTFGELRPGHFHAGIDIKSLNGSPGEQVLAAAGGYISRIAVSPGGYGNALYISHPNGYTTVYAHLDRFTPDVAAYVRKKQYDGRKFKVNLYPRPDQFVVDAGDLIGYLGNSGSSFGPHLHFEVRRTADQVPINPFHFGFEITDNIPPEINHVRLYYMDADHNVFMTRDYTPIEIETGKYALPDTLVEGAWRIGVAVQAYDRMEGVNNRNGAYMVDMEVDGVSQFGFQMDEVSFSKSRYINAHIDYGAAADDLGRMHRCYKLPGNDLNMYKEGPDRGYINLYESDPRRITVKVSDFSGNLSTVDFDILRDSRMTEPLPPLGEKCLPNSSLTITGEGFRFEIPAGTVYAPTYFKYSSTTPKTGDWIGDLHTVGTNHIALHKYCDLMIAVSQIPEKVESKAYIARFPDDEDGETVSYGGTFSGNRITTATRSCGTYGVMIDTIPPKITPVVFSEDMSESQLMRFEITDDVATDGRARGLDYTATVDGKWILMEYDAKNDRLTHWFDEKITPGDHRLRITVSDDRNNVSVFEGRFIR